MKISLTLLIFITSFSLSAQEKLAEFTTSHAQVMGVSTKMDVLFKVYQDSLVMTYMDKRIIKQMEKMGMPVTTRFVHPFVKQDLPHGVHYTFRNETLDFTIQTGSKALKPSVLIRHKDTFSNEVTEQVFITP